MRRSRMPDTRPQYIDALLIERFRQYSLLANYLPRGKTRPTPITCPRCRDGGEPLSLLDDGREILCGASRMAVGNERGVVIGEFEPRVGYSTWPDGTPYVTTVGTELANEPTLLTGAVEVRCGCGFKTRWGCPP